MVQNKGLEICVAIKNVSFAILLGVYIDNRLTWIEHVDISSKKLASKVGVSSELHSLMSSELLMTLFNTIVFQHFDNCCIVWGNTKNTNGLDKLCTCKLQSELLG